MVSPSPVVKAGRVRLLEELEADWAVDGWDWAFAVAVTSVQRPANPNKRSVVIAMSLPRADAAEP